MIVRRFVLAAFWPARKEDFSSCKARWVNLLRCLSLIESKFQSWKSRKPAHSAPLDVDFNNAGDFLKPATKEFSSEPFCELGYSFYGWNSGAVLDGICGAYADVPQLSFPNRILLEYVGYAQDPANAKILRAVLDSHSPESAAIFLDEQFKNTDLKPTFELGYLTYLPFPTKTLRQKSFTNLEPYETGSILTLPALLSDPHEKNANLRKVLSDFGWHQR